MKIEIPDFYRNFIFEHKRANITNFGHCGRKYSVIGWHHLSTVQGLCLIDVTLNIVDVSLSLSFSVNV